MWPAELTRRGCGRMSSAWTRPGRDWSPEVIASIAAMAPRRVVYVSCDPGTLGRDVKRFAEMGYLSPSVPWPWISSPALAMWRR